MRHDEDGRAALELAGDDDLLLVAAGQLAHALAVRGGADIIFFHHGLRVGVDGALVQAQTMTVAEARIVGVLEDKIFRDRHIADQALQVAVLGDVADAVLDEAVRVEDGDAVTLEPDRAALRGDDAGDELGQLGLAVAVDTRDADDLSGVDAERQIGEAAVLALLVIVHMVELRDDLMAGGVDLFIV